VEWEGVLLGRSHSPNFLFMVRLKILHKARVGFWYNISVAMHIDLDFADGLAYFSCGNIDAVLKFNFFLRWVGTFGAGAVAGFSQWG
jgi:hypothetical protein